MEIPALERSQKEALQETLELVQKDSSANPMTVADEVYEVLRTLIVTGVLQSQTTLDQHELAKILNVSRTPLRQALLQLTQDGLVSSEPRRTAQVSALSRAEARELYALRSVIEPLVGQDSAKRLKSADIETLRDLNNSMENAIRTHDYDTFVALDRAFHRLYYSRSRYIRGAGYIETLRNASDRYIHEFAVHSAHSLTSVEQHSAILDATVERRFDRIEGLIRQHVEGGAHTLLELID